MLVLERKNEEMPLVSILCPCYNHEKFLEDCLNSLLSQKTNFPYEIVIHDDASTDKSQEILKKYYEEHSDKITLILQSENVYSNRIKILPNFFIPYGRGKYYAFCECDDYFTDDEKLQIQYDFLEGHPEYNLTSHASIRVDAVSKNTVNEWRLDNKNREVSLQEMIKVGGMLMPTNSMFFRSDIFKAGMPEFYNIAPIGDTPTMIYLGFHGKAYYFNRIMSAYRINNPASQTSVSTNSSLDKRRKDISRAIKMYELMDVYSENKYHELFEYAINRLEFGYYYVALNIKKLKEKRFNTFRKEKTLFWPKCYMRLILPKLYKKLSKHFGD